MLNDTSWQDAHAHFLEESQMLLSKCQECVAHLELISDDKDAVDCLLGTLFKLSETAENALIPCTAQFARQLRAVLCVAYPKVSLTDEALKTLEHCLTLLAWQLELIDPQSGQLLLDDSEQTELLDHFAATCGLPERAQLQPSSQRPCDSSALVSDISSSR
jgi:hypothetical protein